MGILETLFPGGSLLGQVKDIIGAFKLDPTKKAELQSLVDEHAFEIQQKQADMEAKAMEYEDNAVKEASLNIRTEEGSDDAFVRRARPGFLWVMTIAIGINLLVFPLINICTGKGLVFPEIPAAYLNLFGVGFLGYTGARTWEKVSGVNKS